MNLCFTDDLALVEKRDCELHDQLVVGNLECAFPDDMIASGKAYVSVLPTSCIDHVAVAGLL